MKDIEDIIEQVHEAGRGRLEQDCLEPEWQIRPTVRAWRYAAASAALVVAGGLLLLLPLKRSRPTPEVALGELPHSVEQQLDEVWHTAVSPQAPVSQSDYAYSESSAGVRVYCTGGCNADEVLARMEMVIKTLQ